MKKNLPAIQYYIGDHRKDIELGSLDFEAKGVWWEMVLLMHVSTDYGKLVLNGKPIPDAVLAQLLSTNEATLQRNLSKILDHGVGSMEEDTGIIYCRRMVREADLSKVRAEAGRKGGKKSRPPQPTLFGSKNEAQEPASSSSSVSTSTSKETNTGTLFEEFWTAYPRRKGSNPKRPAREKWEKATQKIHYQELLALTIRFALRMEAEETIGTPFVPQATTWLNQERWTDERDDHSGNSGGSVERYVSW